MSAFHSLRTPLPYESLGRWRTWAGTGAYRTRAHASFSFGWSRGPKSSKCQLSQPSRRASRVQAKARSSPILKSRKIMSSYGQMPDKRSECLSTMFYRTQSLRRLLCQVPFPAPPEKV